MKQKFEWVIENFDQAGDVADLMIEDNLADFDNLMLIDAIESDRLCLMVITQVGRLTNISYAYVFDSVLETTAKGDMDINLPNKIINSFYDYLLSLNR